MPGVPPFREALIEAAAEHETTAALLEGVAKRKPCGEDARRLLAEARHRRTISEAAREAAANWI